MVQGFQPQMQNISYGAIKDVAPQQVVQKLPENIQNFDAQDTFENNSTVQMVTSKSTDLKTGAMTVGIWGGFIGLRSLLDKVTAGEWDKSLLGKVTKFGDTLSSGLNKVSFGLLGKASNGLKSGTENAAKMLTGKFDLAAAFKTPFKYENSMAISQGNGMAGRLFNDDIMNAVKRFDEKKLVNLFGKLDDFKGMNASQIIDKFQNIATNPLGKENAKVVNDIMETFAKSGETFKISHFNLPFGIKLPMTGKFNPLRIFEVKMPGSSIANKYKALAKTSSAKTALGKNLTYISSSATEGLTSCVVGGKVAPLIQAAIVANAIKKAMDAPEGQKLSTFMDEMVPQAAFFMTMPYTTKSLASIGGSLKYLGMSGEVDKEFLKQVEKSPELLKKLGLEGKDLSNLAKGDRQVINVEHFRQSVKSLNDKIKAGGLDGVQYQAELGNIKKIFKGNSKWYQKPFKFIGKVLGGGYKAETVMPFIKENGNKITDTLSKAKYALKTKGGGALRFAAVMFVISPLIAKPITALTHKIFGKPYDAEAEAKKKQEEEAKKAQDEAIKNLGMTEEQLMAKLEAHPEIIQAIQSDPQIMAQIQQNPILLLQLIASIPDDASNNGQQAQQNTQGQNSMQNGQIQTKSGMQQNGTQSDLLQKYINNPNNRINSGMNQNSQQISQNAQNISNVNQTQKDEPKEPVRTYIPSSKPFNYTTGDTLQNSIKPEQITNQNVINMLSKADKAEADAWKIL